MRLLMLSWKDRAHPQAGGAERLTHCLLKELVRRGHSLTLLCPRYPQAPTEEILAGYRIIRAGNSLTVYIHAWRLWQSNLKNQKFDAVIDQIHGLPFFTPLYIKHTPIFALLFEVAGDIWTYRFPWPLGNIAKAIEPAMLRLYRRHRFLTIALSTAGELAHLGIPENRLTVIPPCVVQPAISLPSKDGLPTIIWINRLAPAKQLDHALIAFQQAKKSIPSLRFWLITSSLSPINISNIKDVKIFLRISETKKYQLLARSHILIQTSIKEGYGLTIIEAGLCGTPAIGYRVPGTQDAIIHNHTGLLVDKNNPDSLAAAIVDLIKNTDRLQLLGQHARQHNRQFTCTAAAQLFEKAISETLPPNHPAKGSSTTAPAKPG